MRLMATGNDEGSYLKLYHSPKMTGGSLRALRSLQEPLPGNLVRRA
jgi:hypothetical protein